MKPKGWRNESARHSMASRGIKTAQKMPSIKFYTDKMGRKRWKHSSDGEAIIGKPVRSLGEGTTYDNWADLLKDEKEYLMMIHNVNNEKEYIKYLKQFGIKQRPQLPKKWKKSGLYNNIPGSKTYHSGQIEYGNAKEVLVLRNNPHDIGWVVFKYENSYEPNVGVVRGDIQQRKSFKTKKEATDYLMRLVK